MEDDITKRARIGFFRLIFCVAFLLGVLVVDARACSEVFIDKGGKVKVSARNFDFPASNGFVRYSPAGTDRQAQYAPQDSFFSSLLSYEFDKHNLSNSGSCSNPRRIILSTS